LTASAEAVTFETVIGLEVHAQLRTETKIFCGCRTRFGDPPNSNTCPVCLGMPGTLPVLNRKVVEFAIKAALATGCTINKRSVFARKNYFYPDLPKGYQISQYDQPIAEHGKVPIEAPGGPMEIGLTRIHMEEDAGKLIHEGMADSATRSYADYNRAGTPLIEIVSEPEIRNSEEAYLYLNRLRSILLYLEICDGNMEEGSLRCDANISLRPVNTTPLGTKVEIKNLNSFRNVQRALNYEIRRQTNVLHEAGEIVQETRLWNADEGLTSPMRSKEEAMDYRYFPDPDLPPLEIEQAWIDELAGEIPELPAARKARYIAAWEIPEQDANFLTAEPKLSAYFEAVAERSGNPRASGNWVISEMQGRLNEAGLDIEDSPVEAGSLGNLIKTIDAGTISGKIAKTVFDEMFKSGGEPDAIIKSRGLLQISDEGQLQGMVAQVIADNPSQVEQYRAGKKAALGWFVGQVMKASRGQANPGLVNKLLKEKLG
jgi:aspartyl-tRNA(Asn)/glutamyl-tRNA(Gln) amidotransferase subunit B